MGNPKNAGRIIVALFCAGMMLAIVMLAMPTIQPVLVSIAAVLTPILSSDASWAADFVTNTVVPIMPIALAVITFVGVFLRMSRGGKII